MKFILIINIRGWRQREADAVRLCSNQRQRDHLHEGHHGLRHCRGVSEAGHVHTTDCCDQVRADRVCGPRDHDRARRRHSGPGWEYLLKYPQFW